ncbi:fibulin-2-like isoform X2 [Cheilinus undulatus]|uniref:fibulin-2-like isoform X2 n=1 Tax=Cheilinus undulatus TaxID=241271 RepID=UPI001BD56A66|nr:fibulin-2-like isoform X2 [Cheilinus undulatus]
MDNQRVILFLCWVSLCMDICFSQEDCTGVDCPDQQNCLESVLEKGACCPTCTQKGCTCEGYQYYDCIQAGFRRGKVPEGESYFVDFGSTECSCPQGGGRITCHFIPCPEISPNCIDIAQPADGCPQCRRIGCTHGNKKYEAGHSFHLNKCQVCHCPNEGGRLMCSPIPGCDLRSPNKPVQGTTTENNNPLRDINTRHDGQQTTPVGPFSKLALGNTLPLYKQDPPSFGRGDYDYTLAGPTSATIQNLAQALESTTPPPFYPESSATSLSSQDYRRQELRDKRKSSHPERSSEAEVTHDMDPTTARAQSETSTSVMTTTQRVATENQQEVSDRPTRHNGDRNKAVKDTARTNKGARHSKHSHSQSSRTGSHGGTRAAGHKEQDKVTLERRQQSTKEGQGSYPKLQFSPTNRAPVRMDDGGQPQRQPQTLHTYYSQEAGEDPEVSAEELVTTCCETGEKWASANGHCNNMEPPTRDRQSICWTAQQQCCLGSLRENQCSAGINAARAGNMCRDANDKCGINSYKECCDCCSLGLHFHREGHHCDAHQYLGFHCRHVFLTCCEGEGSRDGTQDGWYPVRERPAVDPTAAPKKVSDSPYPKEAFSIGEEQDRENAVEVEDMDECQIHDICHHRCINMPGSFRCECFPGYVLQADAFTCAQEATYDDNGLKEDSGAAVEPTSTLPPPNQPPVPLNPCEGNSPCEHHCASVGGTPQCSCFPGFSLMADGHSCEDINECLSAHVCQPNERCMNTAGSYICQRLITCPPGHQINNDICEDINECVQQSHNCGPGFDCVNTEGSFRCNAKPQCPVGYSRDSQGSCMDIDECGALAQPCSLGFNCINTVGSYMCQRKIICSRGYHASPDGSRCIDVNECQSNLHRCGEGQLCHNLPGSYRCECQTGYQFDSFRKMCVDVNECWRYPGRLCAQTCENTPGSYECTCTTGFRLSGDGKNCEDIDECTTGAHNCSLSETCYNIQGGYRCLSLNCPPNYRKVSDARCERINCLDYLECQNSPLRITYYYLSFQSNIIIPAQIFRIGPSPAYAGDNVIVSITQGNEENYFSTRKLNAYTGAVYLHRQVEGPRDFLITVEMKLWRQGAFTTFQARIYVFITASSLS